MGRGRGTAPGSSRPLPRAATPIATAPATGPAPESTLTVLLDGTREWRDEEGLLHREGDEPAIVSADGLTRKWFRHGKPHRDGDQPALITPRSRIWMVNGVHHREGGPASEDDDGSFVYRRDDKIHREDGPAVRTADGTETYWLEGRRVRGERARAIVKASEARVARERALEAERIAAARPRTVRAAMNRR